MGGGGIFFERLLTKYSNPEELFGPLSLSALERDEYIRNTDVRVHCFLMISTLVSCPLVATPSTEYLDRFMISILLFIFTKNKKPYRSPYDKV